MNVCCHYVSVYEHAYSDSHWYMINTQTRFKRFTTTHSFPEQTWCLDIMFVLTSGVWNDFLALDVSYFFYSQFLPPARADDANGVGAQWFMGFVVLCILSFVWALLHVLSEITTHQRRYNLFKHCNSSYIVFVGRF